eukprot:CAMPEP_0180301764 /NCGR_PEP_ID=MMETSP0988-20121125/23719_1 /TAXON_ID=697907 /ORGANISM="non described non described, Strain CCMP2293" /LENGTH=44 /DNA_ID= /DNA_START= /DNA_END= /DNA_ORIENTATION=
MYACALKMPVSCHAEAPSWRFILVDASFIAAQVFLGRSGRRPML